jgi:hypothetical protein
LASCAGWPRSEALTVDDGRRWAPFAAGLLALREQDAHAEDRLRQDIDVNTVGGRACWISTSSSRSACSISAFDLDDALLALGPGHRSGGRGQLSLKPLHHLVGDQPRQHVGRVGHVLGDPGDTLDPSEMNVNQVAIDGDRRPAAIGHLSDPIANRLTQLVTLGTRTTLRARWTAAPCYRDCQT